MATSGGSEINVVCRFRPLNDLEQTQGNKVCVDFSADGRGVYFNKTGSKDFTFDKCFSPSASQEDIFAQIGLPAVQDLFGGYNTTIFSYGQTGSGKTYSMLGPSSRDVLSDTKTQGLIPRIVREIFNAVGSADESVEFTIKTSFFEIYMERIKDLLNPENTNLSIKEERTDDGRGVYVADLTEEYVDSAEQVMSLIESGFSLRMVASTRMNSYSSRSHCIMQLTLTQTDTKKGEKKHSKLFMVDLAGSEKVDKTLAEGLQLEEAKMINLSLTTLGRVIYQLTDGKTSHIPYRESKLTRLLQDALGGNSRTTLLINCSPSPYNEQETVSTLRFGERAKNIKNKPRINKELTVEQMKAQMERALSNLAEAKAQAAFLQKELDLLKSSGNTSDPEAWARTKLELQKAFEDKEKLLESTIRKKEEENMNLVEENKTLRDTITQLQIEVQCLTNQESSRIVQEEAEELFEASPTELEPPSSTTSTQTPTATAATTTLSPTDKIPTPSNASEGNSQEIQNSHMYFLKNRIFELKKECECLKSQERAMAIHFGEVFARMGKMIERVVLSQQQGSNGLATCDDSEFSVEHVLGQKPLSVIAITPDHVARDRSLSVFSSFSSRHRSGSVLSEEQLRVKLAEREQEHDSLLLALSTATKSGSSADLTQQQQRLAIVDREIQLLKARISQTATTGFSPPLGERRRRPTNIVKPLKGGGNRKIENIIQEVGSDSEGDTTSLKIDIDESNSSSSSKQDISSSGKDSFSSLKTRSHSLRALLASPTKALNSPTAVSSSSGSNSLLFSLNGGNSRISGAPPTRNTEESSSDGEEDSNENSSLLPVVLRTPEKFSEIFHVDLQDVSLGSAMLKCGYLYKATKSMKATKKRWFALKSNSFSYYDRLSDVLPVREILFLDGHKLSVSLPKDDQMRKEAYFQVLLSPTSSADSIPIRLVLQAASEDDVSAWLCSFRKLAK